MKYLALREACSQLGVLEDDLNIDDDVEKFVQGDNIDEEDKERVATVDDERDNEVFEERER